MKLRPTWSEPFARPFGWASLADSSRSFAEFAAPHETTTTSAANVSCSPSRSTTTPVTAVPAGFVSSFTTRASVQQGDVRMLERRAHADHLGVGLGVEDAGEAVAVGAAHARAVGRVRLVEEDPARRMERVVAGARQVVGELLDARLVRDRRMRVVAARVRLGRVLPAGTVHLVELLGLRVVRLELVVGDRPGGRDAVVVLKLAEVLPAQAVESGAVELGRAADEVVHLGLERLAARVVPRLRRDVAVLDEDVSARASSPARGGASRPAPAAGCAFRRERGGGRGCRRRRRSR